ncbi:hypothetical protein CISG_02494 [Coccidioides immitis RMSCC 3703]|uniref:Mediator of RNA polymerase II transcription subunit 20 n=1 Tax=Coccidioides immitis RMSCC 3703 TaxID=454286 RepID=A0A0J8R8D0_COCIT|nr:hypothetical protein CISG_02494 [Coccidioides immitis RMSCC 3703]
MPVTGNSSQPVTSSLQCRANWRWALEHKLLRDTPSCLPPSAYAPLPQLQPRFMHFLSLSHFQSHGFVYISDRPSPDPWAPSQPHHSQAGIHAHPTQQQIPPQPSSSNRLVKEEDAPQVSRSSSSSSWTMMTLDPASFNSFLAITLRACKPLWCHRHTMLVTGGTIFEVGDFPHTHRRSTTDPARAASSWVYCRDRISRAGTDSYAERQRLVSSGVRTSDIGGIGGGRRVFRDCRWGWGWRGRAPH